MISAKAVSEEAAFATLRRIRMTVKINGMTAYRCDAISLVGVAGLGALTVLNLVFRLAAGEPTSAFMHVMVSLLFTAFGAFAWRSRLPALWLAAGAGSVVLTMCSNLIPDYVSDPVSIAQTVIAFVTGVTAQVFQIVERAAPVRFAYVAFTVFLVAGLAYGSYCAGNVFSESTRSGGAEIATWSVPARYDGEDCPEAGELVTVEYPTRAYATDGREVTKRAHVYLPYGYDESERYDILYLLHGTGEDEDTWLAEDASNKRMVDALIFHGDIAPVIIVTPTWYTENDCADDPDRLTYAFASELRNDLIPYVESRYSTYSESMTHDGLVAGRDHRAFAGLSRGSATVMRAGLNASTDYFSMFGAMSGSMTTEEEFLSGFLSEEAADRPIKYFYNSAGAFDFLLNDHLSSYRWLIGRDPRLTEGVNASFDVFPAGYHSMGSWHIALYNSLQHFFGV